MTSNTMTGKLPFVHIEHIGDVIHYAYAHLASDLHLEPGKTSFHIRMRQDY